MQLPGLLRRRSGLVAAAFFAAARLLQVMMTVAVAQLFDKEVAGLAFYIFGLIAFAQAISACGLDNYGNYIFPRRRRRGQLHKMWGYLFLLLCVAVPINVLISLSAYTFPEFSSLTIAPYVIGVIALSATFGTVRRLVRLIFVGLGERARAVVHESIVFYAIMLVMLLAFPIDGIAGITIILLIATVTSFVWAIWDVRNAVPRPPRGYLSELPSYRSGKITLAGAFPSFVAQAAPVLLNRADVLLLAPLSSASEVAIYSVAIRLSFLLSAIVELAGLIWGARLMNVSELAMPARRRLFRNVFLLTATMATAIGAPLIIFPEWCLGFLFGASYTDASKVLVVLVMGKLLTAPFQPILISFVALGHNRVLAKIFIVAAVASIALNFLLIPTLGALGCAIATSAALFLMAGGYIFLLKKCT